MSKSPVEGATCATCPFFTVNTGPANYHGWCSFCAPAHIETLTTRASRGVYRETWCHMHPVVWQTMHYAALRKVRIARRDGKRALDL